MGDPSYGFRLTGVREKSRKAMKPNAISTSAPLHSAKLQKFRVQYINHHYMCQDKMLLSRHQIMGQICCILREEHKLQPNKAGVAEARSPSRQHGRHGIKIRFVLRIQKKYKSMTDQIHQRGRGREYFIPMDRFLCQVFARFGQRVNVFNNLEREDGQSARALPW